jgi:hypothetical protein
MGAPFVDFLSSVRHRLARTVAAIVGSASTTNPATIVGTSTCRRVRLGGDIDDVFESALTIQGVVIVPVDGALEGGYYGACLMSVEVKLTNPDPICGVQGPRGCGRRRSNVGMCGVISEAEKESFPVVEAMGYIYGIGDHLAREIYDLRCEAMDDQNTTEGFQDGLAQAAKFCGKTTDTCAVLNYG